MISEDELRYYKQLDERQRRLFLGMKAKSLGRSGSRIVSKAFGVNIKTVCEGKKELSLLTPPSVCTKQVVELKKLTLHPEWLEAFDQTVELSIAGLLQ